MENGGAKTVDSGEARLRALGKDSPCCMPHFCPACLQSSAQLRHLNDPMWVPKSATDSCKWRLAHFC